MSSSRGGRPPTKRGAGSATKKDADTRDRLSDVMDELMTSGERTLDAALMKELKSACRASDDTLRRVFALLMARMAEPHAQVRFSALLVASELFVRSHLFRQLLVDEFQRFIELCVGREPDHPLPPPQDAAEELREKAVRAVADWNVTYGPHYRKLALGYEYLRDGFGVDFETMRVRDRMQQKREEEYAARRLRAMQQRWEVLDSELGDVMQEIDKTLAEINEGLALLVPASFEEMCEAAEDGDGAADAQPEDSEVVANAHVDARHVDSGNGAGPIRDGERAADASMSDADADGDEDEMEGGDEALSDNGDAEPAGDRADDAPRLDAVAFARKYGLGTTSYELQIQLTGGDLVVSRTEENAPLVDSVLDALALVEARHLPAVQRLIDSAARIEWEERARDLESAIKRLIDAKEALNEASTRARTLGLHAGMRRGKKRDDAGESAAAAVGGGDEEDDAIPMRPVEDKDGYEAAAGAEHVPDASVKEGYEESAFVDEDFAPSECAQLPARPVDVPKRVAQKQLTSGRPSRDFDPTVGKTTLTFSDDRVVMGVGQAGTRKPKRNGGEDEGDARVNDGGGDDGGEADARGSAEEEAGTGDGNDEHKARVRRLMKVAPVIPYGADLSYWTGDILPTNANELESYHRFWAPKDMDVKPTSAFLDQVMSRVSYYEPKVEPVQHQCRAPLPSGKLCQRRDRERCPFHGKIVPRDDLGVPLGSDAAGVAEATGEKVAEGALPSGQPKRRHSNVGEEEGTTKKAKTEGAKGADEGAGRGNGRGRGRRGGLADTRPKETVLDRISRRIMHPSALRRTGEEMKRYEMQRHGDKFGSLWQYS